MTKKLLLLSALLLGTACAHISAVEVTSQATQTAQPRPGQLPSSVTRTAAPALQHLLANGGSVQLLDAQGNVVGTLNPDGSANLVSDAALSQVSSLRSMFLAAPLPPSP